MWGLNITFFMFLIIVRTFWTQNITRHLAINVILYSILVTLRIITVWERDLWASKELLWSLLLHYLESVRGCSYQLKIHQPGCTSTPFQARCV